MLRMMVPLDTILTRVLSEFSIQLSEIKAAVNSEEDWSSQTLTIEMIPDHIHTRDEYPAARLISSPCFLWFSFITSYETLSCY